MSLSGSCLTRTSRTLIYNLVGAGTKYDVGLKTRKGLCLISHLSDRPRLTRLEQPFSQRCIERKRGISLTTIDLTTFSHLQLHHTIEAPLIMGDPSNNCSSALAEAEYRVIRVWVTGFGVCENTP